MTIDQRIDDLIERLSSTAADYDPHYRLTGTYQSLSRELDRLIEKQEAMRT